MKVGLIDVDGHNFPNVPLMKLSAWHKAQGDHVEWYDPMFSGHVDKVYMSKVFSFSPDYQYFINADEIIKGGSGYANSEWMKIDEPVHMCVDFCKKYKKYDTVLVPLDEYIGYCKCACLPLDMPMEV